MPTNPRITKIKKGINVMTPERQKAIESMEATKRANKEADAQEDKRYAPRPEGMDPEYATKLHQDVEARAEDGTTGVDYKSQEQLKKKREMDKRRTSMNAADSLSRGGM